MAIDAGAHALGLVSAMPSGPGVISDELAAELAAEVPPGVDAFLLTSLQEVDVLVEQSRRIGARALQLVDALPPGAHAELRLALPGRQARAGRARDGARVARRGAGAGA